MWTWRIYRLAHSPHVLLYLRNKMQRSCTCTVMFNEQIFHGLLTDFSFQLQLVILLSIQSGNLSLIICRYLNIWIVQMMTLSFFHREFHHEVLSCFKQNCFSLKAAVKCTINKFFKNGLFFVVKQKVLHH